MSEHAYDRIYETMGLTRCKETAIHLAVGAWEYRVEHKPHMIRLLLKQGWKIAIDYGTHKLLKYTHWERIE